MISASVLSAIKKPMHRSKQPITNHLHGAYFSFGFGPEGPHAGKGTSSPHPRNNGVGSQASPKHHSRSRGSGSVGIHAGSDATALWGAQLVIKVGCSSEGVGGSIPGDCGMPSGVVEGGVGWGRAVHQRLGRDPFPPRGIHTDRGVGNSMLLAWARVPWDGKGVGFFP